ncbi:MAG: STN domain-containing protein [Planctomycetota bacterium]|nr:STN domain-containing protein [Planctomycetota bacterium]
MVEPAAAGGETPQNVETATRPDVESVHDTDSSENAVSTRAEFDEAASPFDKPRGVPASATPDLTETVEDLSVQAVSKPAAHVDGIEAEGDRVWRDDPEEFDEPHEAASSHLSPPPRPASDEVLLPNADWTSASTAQWRNRVLLGMAAVVGVVLAVVLFVMFSGSSESPTAASLAVESDLPASSTADSSAVSDPSASHVETVADDAGSVVAPRDGTTAGSTEPPIEQPAEVPAPDAANPPPAPSGDDPETAVPPADEPPGLSPKEPMTDATATGGEPSALSETFREFGALLEETNEPTSPRPAVDTELPPLPEAGEADEDPVVRRTGPRVVALHDRLNDTIVQIEFDGVPLSDFLRFVSDYSTIPITLDADILQWVRVSPNTAVTLNASNTTVADVLNQGLAPLGLEHRIEADQLFITRRPKEETGIRTVTFKVEDLVGDDANQLQQLGTWIMDFVEPDSWSSRGGIGAISFRGSELVIEQSETVQFEILGFCEKLRVARGLKTRSPYDAAMFRLETRGERARGMLAQSITLTYIRPAPLPRIAARIAETAKLHILIDWRALAEAGWSPDAEVRFSVADQPLAKALATLLEPMDLAYRVVDESTLQVTTPAVVDSRLEIEFYRVTNLNGDAAQIVQAARDALGTANFRDFGGSGQLVFDEPSHCLLACLSQTRLIELQAWLAAQ